MEQIGTLHYDHLNSDRANEETAILVKDFVFSASFNIHTPLQVTTTHLNLLNLLLNAATPTYPELYQCLLLNLLVSYHTHPVYYLCDINARNIIWGSVLCDDRDRIVISVCAGSSPA
jgi:hypothetical protein